MRYIKYYITIIFLFFCVNLCAKGKYIVFYGGFASGKSTQSMKVIDYLKKNGLAYSTVPFPYVRDDKMKQTVIDMINLDTNVIIEDDTPNHNITISKNDFKSSLEFTFKQKYNNPKPDYIFFLDVDDKIRMERFKKRRHSYLYKLSEKEINFTNSLTRKYIKELNDPTIITIDTGKNSIDETFNIIKKYIEIKK